MTRLLLAVPALFAVVALAGATGPPTPAHGESVTQSDTLTVTGTGSVSAAPDDAQLTFGVESRADTARAALAANGEALRKVIAALRGAGARELQTQWVSLWPVAQADGSTRGYGASNSVSAVIGVAQAGALIDAAVGAGANQVSGPDLRASDAKRLYERHSATPSPTREHMPRRWPRRPGARWAPSPRSWKVDRSRSPCTGLPRPTPARPRSSPVSRRRPRR